MTYRRKNLHCRPIIPLAVGDKFTGHGPLDWTPSDAVLLTLQRLSYVV